MPYDPNTCANFNEVTLEHIDFDWFVDFEKTRITGSCAIQYLVLKDTNKIVFDVSDQLIEEVKLNGQPCKVKMGEVPLVGRSMTLNGKFKQGERGVIRCRYSTSSSATALQFVEAQLTADKRRPFLYSQCQQIHARSIVPCMDTPAVKQTFTAAVNVPEGIQCLMGAILLENNEQEKEKQQQRENEKKNGTAADGRVTYHFLQKVPIPSYLFAIVAGALEKRDISDRCAVWAEPSMVDRAHWEFAETETMLETAIQLMGEYRWGRFDMIVLPPFFSFGGMENPCMTFVTPTIIAGDRSLTTVVAHEIAHSWTGNLVTNASWEHFWLNEGFTEFVEYKILGRMFGEQFRLFMHLSGWEDSLRMCVHETLHPGHPFTKLVVPLEGQCADDVFSPIPYQKGAALLLLLEQRLGDNARFEQFLRDYVLKFAYRSIVTDEWKDYLFEYFADQRQVLDTIEWDKWLHQPGMPPQKPTFDETLLIGCQSLANAWLYGADDAVKGLSADEFQQMVTAQKEKVLSLLDTGIAAGQHRFDHKRIELMERKYSLGSTGNCDVKSQWIMVAIQARWEPIIAQALQFVTECGRVKYVRSCYQRLFEWERSRQAALDCFERNRPQMHNFTQQFVLSLLSNKNKANPVVKEQNGTDGKMCGKEDDEEANDQQLQAKKAKLLLLEENGQKNGFHKNGQVQQQQQQQQNGMKKQNKKKKVENDSAENQQQQPLANGIC